MSWIAATVVGLACLPRGRPPAGAGADRPMTVCGRTLDGWREAARDEFDPDRARAVEAIGLFGVAAAGAVPDLIDLIDDLELSPSATWSLGRIGPAAARAVPILVGKLAGDDTAYEQDPAATALAAIGPAAVPALIGHLEAPASPTRARAATILGRIGPGAEAAVPALIRSLKDQGDEDVSLVTEAIEALGRIGPASRPAIPALRALFGERGAEVFGPHGTELTIALDRIGEPPVGPLLNILLLNDGDIQGGYELVFLGPKARAAAPLLRLAEADERPPIRATALIALAMVDRPDPACFRVLVEELSRDGGETALALWALAELGPAAKPAVPGLLRSINTGRPVEAARMVALGLLQNEDGVSDVAGLLVPWARARLVLGMLGRPTLAAGLLRDGLDGAFGIAFDFSYQEESIQALARIDPTNPAVLAATAAALTDENQVVSVAAADSLGLIGPAAASALPALERAVRIGPVDAAADSDLPAIAARAIRRIGPAGRRAIPTLIRAFDPPDNATEPPPPIFRAVIATVLGQVGRGEPKVVDLLTKALAPAPAPAPAPVEAKGERVMRPQGAAAQAETTPLRWIDRDDPTGETDPAVPIAAAQALARLGPEAASALPALRRTLAAPDVRVAAAAAAAIARIAPDGPAEARRWLDALDEERSLSPWAWAVVLGAVGRPSLEADAILESRIGTIRLVLDSLDVRYLRGFAALGVETSILELAEFGPAGHSAVPYLRTLQADSNPWLRLWATEALAEIEPGP